MTSSRLYRFSMVAMIRRASFSEVLRVFVLLVVTGACRATYPENTIAWREAPDCPGSQYYVQGYCTSTKGPRTGPDAGTAADGGSGPGQRDSQASPEPSGAFEVLARLPDTGDELQDPRQAIVVTFSTPVDWTTVTEQSVRVLQAEDALPIDLVPNELNDTELQVQPRAPLTLSRPYTISLLSSVRDRERRSLPETSWTFRVRAGEWSQEKRSDRETDAADEGTKLAVSRNGNVVVSSLVFHTDPRGFRYRVERRIGRDWERLPSFSDKIYDLDINAEGWVALGTGDALTVFDLDGAVWRKLTRVGDVLPSVAFTGLDLIHMLDNREEKLVAVTQPLFEMDATEAELTSGETKQTIRTQPVGFARLSQHWHVAYTQTVPGTDGFDGEAVWLSEPRAQDGAAATAVRVSREVSRDKQPALSGNVSENALVAVWREVEGDASIVRAAHLRAGDKAWRSPLTIPDSDAAKTPKVVLDEHGNATAAWIEQNAESATVRSNHYTASRDYWSSQAQYLSSTWAPRIEHLALAGNAAGQAIAAWLEAPQPDDDAGVSAGAMVLRCRIYDPLKDWSDAVSLSQDFNVYFEIDVGMSDDGRAFVSWIEDGDLRFARYE
jgi:hypothetical protein